jgi:hypothetical protein
MSMRDENIATNVAWLREAFLDVQRDLELGLRRATKSIEHAGTKGAVNEDNWIHVFREYLPKRYEVGTGIIIDSRGERSQQIDIVIFDKHFTPTLLDQQRHRYIPAEAVYAVFEAKPHFDKSYLEYAGEKAASVRSLKRTSVSIAHAGGIYEPKRIFPIIAGIVAAKSDWADGLGDSFRQHLPGAREECLDCGCALEHGAFDQFDNSLNVVPRDGALIYFLFRLLGKLQSLGTVPAIDWAAYADVVHALMPGTVPSDSVGTI